MKTYDELLPELTTRIDRGTSAYPRLKDLLAPIVRAGHVVGGEDARRVGALFMRHEAWEMMERKHTVPDGAGGLKLDLGEDEGEYRQLGDAFWSAVIEYENWLRARLDKRL